MDELIFLWYYICRNRHDCVCLVNFISAVLINLNRNKSNGVLLRNNYKNWIAWQWTGI